MELVIRNRRLIESDLTTIRGLIQDEGSRGRTHLSRRLCRLWEWRQPNGVYREIACRDLLRQLDARNLIQLPTVLHPARRPGYKNRVQTPNILTDPMDVSLDQIKSPAGARIHRYRRGFAFVFAGCILGSFSMPRLTYSKRDAIRQAVAMQKLCFSNAQLLDQDIRASVDKEQRARVATGLGHLVRAWKTLEDSKRVLKGDPMPGCLKPTERQPRKRKQPTPEEVAESMGMLAKQSAGTEPNQPKNG